ncbi:hypothetical protein V501_03749 [Pseudogymnoascus sp. VKM F-4519 (FW-2642)]|nr:hypothetical protein V501_03749 [Pseudogymnoascus sp. VKM F-4519 (FW-2642)]
MNPLSHVLRDDLGELWSQEHNELHVHHRGEQNHNAHLDSETLKVRLVNVHARVPVNTLPRLLDRQRLAVNRHNSVHILLDQASVNASHNHGDRHHDQDDEREEHSSHSENLHQARLGILDSLPAGLAINALEQAERAGEEEWYADGELLGQGNNGGDGRDLLECLDGWEAAEPGEGRWGGDNGVSPSHADGGEDDHGEDVAEAVGEEGEDDAELAAEEDVHDEHAESAVAAEESTGLAEVLEGGANAGCDWGLLDEGDLALFEEGLLVRAIFLLFGGRGLDQEGGGGLDHGEGGDEVARGRERTYHHNGEEEDDGGECQSGDGERGEKALVAMLAVAARRLMSLVDVHASADDVARDGIHDSHGDVSRDRRGCKSRLMVKVSLLSKFEVEVEEKERNERMYEVGRKDRSR